ncbi:hypothetical protein LNQ81_03570 [Myroides sp. M-43]|uniref:hypothetical protein n=1 Tax=Myroides oncorhynchi TaxID=2893756 RepID=UPI001E607402|nr:hypothetical protein [Myroides oncorhynchi]MCC9041778.1 hypothetical protein [Myroides oncorhynchi]
MESKTEVETISPITLSFKENQVIDQVHTLDQNPTIDSEKCSNEDKTIPPFRIPFKEEKLKKWTPPGFIRKVNKEIIKHAKTTENEEKTNQMDKKPNNDSRSILELDTITEEQKE